MSEYSYSDIHRNDYAASTYIHEHGDFNFNLDPYRDDYAADAHIHKYSDLNLYAYGNDYTASVSTHYCDCGSFGYCRGGLHRRYG